MSWLSDAVDIGGDAVGSFFGDPMLGNQVDGGVSAILNGFSVPTSGNSSASSSGTSLLPSLINGGAQLLGGVMQQNSAQAAVQQSEQFQEQERLSSYPDTVASMEAAGLNPVLAATQGALGLPSGAMYNPQNILGGAVNSAVQSYETLASVANTQANTAATLATLPNKTLENKPAFVINSILDNITGSLQNSAGSIKSADLPKFSIGGNSASSQLPTGLSINSSDPYFNDASSQDVGLSTSDDWLTQLQHAH